MVYFILNRRLNRAEILTGFRCWEEVQGCFRVGFRMSDGNSADGIGRSKSLEEFICKSNHGKTTVLMPEENPFTLTIEVNGSKSEVASDVWRSWTGRRFINGLECEGERFYWLTNKVAPVSSALKPESVVCPACGKGDGDCDCDPVCPKTHAVW